MTAEPNAPPLGDILQERIEPLLRDVERRAYQPAYIILGEHEWHDFVLACGRFGADAGYLQPDHAPRYRGVQILKMSGRAHHLEVVIAPPH